MLLPEPLELAAVHGERLRLLEREDGRRAARCPPLTSASSPKLSPGPRMPMVAVSPSGVMIWSEKRPLATRCIESPGSSRWKTTSWRGEMVAPLRSRGARGRPRPQGHLGEPPPLHQRALSILEAGISSAAYDTRPRRAASPRPRSAPPSRRGASARAGDLRPRRARRYPPPLNGNPSREAASASRSSSVMNGERAGLAVRRDPGGGELECVRGAQVVHADEPSRVVAYGMRRRHFHPA